MRTDADGRQLLSTRQVAQLAGVTVTTVNRWVEQGKLPVAAKAPGSRGAHMYRRDTVEAFLTAASSEGANHSWHTPPIHTVDVSPQPRRRSSD